jgi:thiamine-phosphate pyrophosphorylase
LHVLTDRDLAGGESHVQIAQAAIAGGATIIQLREKHASGQAFYEAAQKVRQLCREARVPLIINDRLDICLAVDADGVHLGQDDLPGKAARQLLGPGRILGGSATTLEEALQVERDGADYVGFGPVYEARTTKPDTVEPLGLEALSQVCQECTVPVIAIGGINAGNVETVLAAGAHGVAVISAIVADDDIAGATRQIRARIENRKGRSS